jgi:hypothetical protein
MWAAVDMADGPRAEAAMIVIHETRPPTVLVV